MTKNTDTKTPGENPDTAAAATSAAEQKRASARRRFLRIGAAGSAAVMVTVVHQRAFAGVKKATVASACASLRGVPDLKRVTQKKALEASAFGTPKGLICRPKSGPDPNAIGDCTRTKTANFFDINGVKPLYVSQPQLAKGCGTLTSTIDKSYNFRLYEKGWCPVKYDATGLFYETTAKYYTKKDGILTANSCELPPP